MSAIEILTEHLENLQEARKGLKKYGVDLVVSWVNEDVEKNFGSDSSEFLEMNEIIKNYEQEKEKLQKLSQKIEHLEEKLEKDLFFEVEGFLKILLIRLRQKEESESFVDEINKRISEMGTLHSSQHLQNFFLNGTRTPIDEWQDRTLKTIEKAFGKESEEYQRIYPMVTSRHWATQHSIEEPIPPEVAIGRQFSNWATSICAVLLDYVRKLESIKDISTDG